MVDIGPGAGEHGGKVVYSGDVAGLLACEESITGAFLSGRRSVPTPEVRRTPGERSLVLEGAREHNLRDVTIQVPLGLFVCVTGVSGSGKSTLVQDVLLRALDRKIVASRELTGKHRKLKGWVHIVKVIYIDQSPFVRTPRSYP
ncbi:MAG: excinuclease ABC subunit A, partial [Actinomycetota bacterium]